MFLTAKTQMLGTTGLHRSGFALSAAPYACAFCGLCEWLVGV